MLTRDELEAKAAAIKPKPRTDSPLPEIDVPDGCGYEGDERVVVQVAYTSYKNNLSGIKLDVLSGAFHRMEVTRLVPFPEWDEDVKALLSVRLGKKEIDTAYRPEGRLSLMFPTAGPRGMADRRPWFKMASQLRRALAETERRLRIEPTDQYALLLVCDILKPVAQTRNGFVFDETLVTAVLDARVVQLKAPVAQPGDTWKKEPEQLADEFGLGDYGDSDDDEEA